MTLLYGFALIGGTWLWLLAAGYTVAGFMPEESRLTRVAVASLTGLAWLILGASLWGAVRKLDSAAVCLLGAPLLATALIPAARRQLLADLNTAVRSTQCYAAAAGLGLLVAVLLLPFFVYPDLVIFDGKTNHDNFFWSIGAEYLQHHNYLFPAPAKNPDHPLYSLADAIVGWQPSWGRMGTEGYLAVISSFLRRSPVEVYNFLACALALPWVLTVLAAARRTGLPALHPAWLLLVCFCQPVLEFFITNGNLPNLLGTIFGGGLWLVALRFIEPGRNRVWPLVLTGALCTHGLVCSYPEITPFAFLPVVLLTAWHSVGRWRVNPAPLRLLVIAAGAGLALNPLTAFRGWIGFWFAVSARQDNRWAVIFSKLNPAEYLPGLITLAPPSMQLYGLLGGVLATLAVAVSAVWLWRQSPRPGVLLVSLAGFLVLLLFTVLTSFSYGWQKSVQFAGVPFAVLFPVLIAGQLQRAFREKSGGWPVRIALAATLGLMVHGTLGQAEDNLKWAGRKGLTRGLLDLPGRIATEFPGRPVYCDGASFHFPFFHSMWSTRLFAGNPLRLLVRDDEPGGYLKDWVRLSRTTTPDPAGLYYVATEWARAFDFPAEPVFADRVGVLRRQHNLVTEMHGFYRPTGVPEAAEDRFALTIYPQADGWLEFTLRPNGAAAPGGRLHGTATTGTQATSVDASPGTTGLFVVRFPLKAGGQNHLEARIDGAPPSAPGDDEPQLPFAVVEVHCIPAAQN